MMEHGTAHLWGVLELAVLGDRQKEILTSGISTEATILSRIFPPVNLAFLNPLKAVKPKPMQWRVMMPTHYPDGILTPPKKARIPPSTLEVGTSTKAYLHLALPANNFPPFGKKTTKKPAILSPFLIGQFTTPRIKL